MTPFSASDAALEGFQLIRRRWRVVLGWAGFNLVTLVMLVVLSAVLSVVAQAVSGGTGTPALAVAGLVVAFCTLFAQAIIAAGVLRVEMWPQEPAFLHLRLGADELRLFLLWLIVITGAWLIGWLATVLSQFVPGVWIELLALAAMVYLGLRFSLAAPISFAERRIDFVRSWRLTRGRVLPLLGMNALSFCLIALVMATVLVALVIAALAAGGLEGLAGLFGGGEAMQSHPGIFLLAFAVEIILTPVLWVLGTAPLVAAYRAFAEPPAEAAAGA